MSPLLRSVVLLAHAVTFAAAQAVVCPGMPASDYCNCGGAEARSASALRPCRAAVEEEDQIHTTEEMTTEEMMMTTEEMTMVVEEEEAEEEATTVHLRLGF